MVGSGTDVLTCALTVRKDWWVKTPAPDHKSRPWHQAVLENVGSSQPQAHWEKRRQSHLWVVIKHCWFQSYCVGWNGNWARNTSANPGVTVTSGKALVWWSPWELNYLLFSWKTIFTGSLTNWLFRLNYLVDIFLENEQNEPVTSKKTIVSICYQQ